LGGKRWSFSPSLKLFSANDGPELRDWLRWASESSDTSNLIRVIAGATSVAGLPSCASPLRLTRWGEDDHRWYEATAPVAVRLRKGFHRFLRYSLKQDSLSEWVELLVGPAHYFAFGVDSWEIEKRASVAVSNDISNHGCVLTSRVEPVRGKVLVALRTSSPGNFHVQRGGETN
jgi:hypothetical protein